MAQTTCSIDGCEAPAKTRTWCSKHYHRWHKHGDANYVGPFTQYRDAGVTKNGGPCTIEGCDNVAKSRGWCWKHYDRWTRHGDPRKEGPRGDRRWSAPTDPVESFWSRVDRTTGCWYWIAYRTARGGYGKFNMGPGETTLAHRISYQWLIGPIPDGMVLDHLCVTPACVRPDHLEPVTVAENSRRAAKSRLRTHCQRGHEIAGDNAYATSNGGRGCRTCLNAGQRERRRRANLDGPTQRWLTEHKRYETYDLPAAIAALSEARAVLAGRTA